MRFNCGWMGCSEPALEGNIYCDAHNKEADSICASAVLIQNKRGAESPTNHTWVLSVLINALCGVLMWFLGYLVGSR